MNENTLPHLQFKGNQKGLSGEIEMSLWNVVAPGHKHHGSTIALSPNPSEEEKEKSLQKKLSV